MKLTEKESHHFGGDSTRVSNRLCHRSVALGVAIAHLWHLSTSIHILSFAFWSWPCDENQWAIDCIGWGWRGWQWINQWVAIEKEQKVSFCGWTVKDPLRWIGRALDQVDIGPCLKKFMRQRQLLECDCTVTRLSDMSGGRVDLIL